MNSIEGALFKTLRGSAAVAAYVVDDHGRPRIYPLRIRQSDIPLKTPAMNYFVVSRRSEITFAGAKKVASARLQVGVWDVDIENAKALMEVVRKLLVPTGQVGSSGFTETWDDVPVSPYGFEYAPDHFEHITKLFYVSAHVLVFFTEST